MIDKFKKNAVTIAITLVFTSTVFAATSDQKKLAITDKKKPDSTVSPSKKDIEKITVTGSRIKRDSFSGATPLVTIGLEGIQDTGLSSLSEILIDNMPSVSRGSSNTNSQSSVQNTGLSTISLRDIGSNRTLTLIDGRRVVSNSYSGNYVSLSTIPAGMVQKVEIISGGASATYGSDAIAGVVNIITQKDKEGLSIKGRVGETAAGGGREESLDFSFGTMIRERGYVYASASYDREHGLFYNDRDRPQQENYYKYDSDNMCNAMLTEDGYQCMRDITKADWRNRSDGTLGGVFGESSKNDTQFWYDESGLRNDWKDNEEKYGVHTDQWVALKVPDESLVAAIKADYELSDNTSSYFQVQYSVNKSVNIKSPEDEYEGAYALVLDPETGAASRIKPGYIPIDNPYVPQEIRDSGLYKDRIYWDRRFAEVGNVTTDNKRTTMRSWAGLQGIVFDDWDWDFSIGYGKFKQQQTRYNELNTRRVAHALDAEYASDGTTIQCADAEARAQGCAPLNLFGIGSISDDAADYIRANPTIETNISQLNVLGYITGELFSLPAGAASAVLGAEYRRDKQTLNTSEEQQYGGITFNVVPSFGGEVAVHELFAELSLPLLANHDAATSLTAELSARIADYDIDNVGIVSSYKAGIVWQPIEGYSVRANVARAQRAPTITELLSPPRGDYDSFTDICKDTTATSTDSGHDNCRLEPTIAAVIANEGIFEGDDNNYSPNTGNDQLIEETGDTFTFGITAAPTSIENLNFAIDYYQITVSDAIAPIDNSDILSGCYASVSGAAWGANNEHCNNITRNDDGEIIELLQRVYNLDQLKRRGYDIAIAYKLDFEQLGKLKFKADFSHVIEHSKTFNDGGESLTNHYTGTLDSGIFKNKASASLTWRIDDFRVRWSTKFKSSVIDSQNRADDYEEDIAENSKLCAQGDDGCILNPEKLAFHHIGSYVKHNLSLSYKVPLKDSGSVRFFGGVNNIFNNNGKFIEGGKGNYDSEYGGGVGRFVYLGAEMKF